MPDGGHRGFQSGGRDLELLRPVADFVGLAHRDPRAVGGLVLLQLEIGLHLLGGVPRFLDGGFQLGWRDLESSTSRRPRKARSTRSARDRPRRVSFCCPPSLFSRRVEKIDASNGNSLTRPLALGQIRPLYGSARCVHGAMVARTGGLA